MVTNAPTAFQALMNHLFQLFLRKFVLVFFDNILVYSNSVAEHIQHLEAVFKVLLDQQLFAKLSKCFFGQNQIEYLGHIIPKQKVSTDPVKITAMIHWPIPQSLKDLKSFSGLTGTTGSLSEIMRLCVDP